MKFDYVGITDKGCKRKGNEDYFIIDEPNRIAVLSDGMGGHNAGEIASEMTSRAVIEYLVRNTESEDYQELLKQAVFYANYLVSSRGKENTEYYGMGATVLIGIFRNGFFHYSWVGDSRIYLLDESGMKQISKDHSYVQQLYDNGLIDEEEMFNHPRKNVLLSAIGVDEKSVEVGYGCMAEEELVGKMILFCSDGLSDMLRNDEIYQIAFHNKLRDGMNKLVVRACEAGGLDNITVIGVSPERVEPVDLVAEKSEDRFFMIMAVCFVAVIFKGQIVKFLRHLENRLYHVIGRRIVSFFVNLLKKK